VLVLSWNVFHGRALPPVDRSLYGEFAAMLAGWGWDLALLQEVPPWWPAQLASELDVEQHSALTSRNSFSWLRRALAERRPELLKSNGGGCNAILSRTAIVERATLRLRCLPERRVAQLVRLRDGTCAVNVHASTRPAHAARELQRLWPHALAWAGTNRLILGGDLNLSTPQLPPASAAAEPNARVGAIAHVAGAGVDHLFARGLEPVAAGAGSTSPAAPGSPSRALVLEGRRVELSDHAPLLVRLRARNDG
jgi:endonuclease/exonuclease/phosphatase family metal-dependent hydrolase